MTFAAGIGAVVQLALGMVVNLYSAIPAAHPGSQPANYLTGSARSLAWAITSGGPALAIHAAFGLALVVMAAAAAGRAVALRGGAAAVVLVVAALLVVGAGFNGASFLDFGGQEISSLLMSLLAFSAVACYLLAGLLLSESRA
jgi:hypothetical protein